jgi:hypothetical protein
MIRLLGLPAVLLSAFFSVTARARVVIAVLVVVMAAAQAEAQSRASWMPAGTYGVMTHYLIYPQGNTQAQKTADLNRIANNFDINTYVNQFQKSGADWLIFTLGQNSNYLCSSNSYFDSLLPGHTPQRDIAMEVAQRVHALGKKMIFYLPSPDNSNPANSEFLNAMRYTEPGYDQRYFNFVQNYSLKFGSLCDGWWFDSCLSHTTSYYNSFSSAARAGNTNSALAFSNVEFMDNRTGSISLVRPSEDYTGGEIHLLENSQIRRDFFYEGSNIYVTEDGKLRREGQGPIFYMPSGPTVGTAQWHGLLPIDQSWNPGIPDEFVHYSDAELFQFVRDVKDVGGALTINVPVDLETGRMFAGSAAQLNRLGVTVFGVPEPSTYVMLGTVFCGIFCWRAHRRTKDIAFRDPCL